MKIVAFQQNKCIYSNNWYAFDENFIMKMVTYITSKEILYKELCQWATELTLRHL